MQEQHEQRRIKLQREKERLQREMRERQEELGRRRREAEEALYASKVEEPSQRVKEYKPKSYAGIWDTEIEF